MLTANLRERIIEKLVNGKPDEPTLRVDLLTIARKRSPSSGMSSELVFELEAQGSIG